MATAAAEKSPAIKLVTLSWAGKGGGEDHGPQRVQQPTYIDFASPLLVNDLVPWGGGVGEGS